MLNRGKKLGKKRKNRPFGVPGEEKTSSKEHPELPEKSEAGDGKERKREMKT